MVQCLYKKTFLKDRAKSEQGRDRQTAPARPSHMFIDRRSTRPFPHIQGQFAVQGSGGKGPRAEAGVV
jgi:hypothetical protein